VVLTGFWLGGQSLLGRPRRRWEENIKMDLGVIYEVNWIRLA
jgi:hypothetical protein